jgi:hypothetical protein
MTWIAPDVERAEPPYVADERIRLDAWLDYELVDGTTGL